MPGTPHDSLQPALPVIHELLPQVESVRKEDLELWKSGIEGYFNWGESLHPDALAPQDGTWVFWILFGLLAVFAAFRLIYPLRLIQLAETFVSARYMRQALREELSLTHPFNLVMLLQYAICSGLLLLKSDINWPAGTLPDQSFFAFLWLSGIPFGLVVVQTMSARLSQFIIGSDGGLSENRYSLILFSEVAGILLLPITILVWFGPNEGVGPLLYLAMGIMLIIYLFRILRGFMAGLNSGTAGIYIFLYFCALELLPVIVALRYFSERFETGY